MRITELGLFGLVTLMSPLAESGASQVSDIDTRTKRTPLPGEFTRVSSVRELRDGSLLIVDRGEGTLFLLADRQREPRAIGLPKGDGPLEYRRAFNIFALGGDSSLLVDGQSARWLIFDGARPIRSFSPEGDKTRAIASNICGASTSGLVVGFSAFGERKPTDPRLRMPSAPRDADSIRIIRGSLYSSAVDTLATVRGGWGGGVDRVNWVNGRAQGGITLHNPGTVEEQACMTPDGHTVVARSQPYRVEWIAPNGARTQGPPLSYERIRFTEAEKRAAISGDYPGSILESFASSEYPPWPAEAPPFVRDALIPLPDARVAIRRWAAAKDAMIRYDVVDRRGVRVSTLLVGKNERLVGAGRAGLYIVTIDEDDVQRLRVFPDQR
jgi:hypothetical protein